MSDRSDQLLDELVRLQVRELRNKATSQGEAIRELGALGFGPDRIAELLGTTVATVRTDLQRAAAKAKPKTKPAPGARDG